MKKFLFLTIFVLLCNISNVNASSKTTYIDLNDMKYSTNNKNYSEITSYDNLDDFFKDYNSNKLDDVYITNFLFDGVSEVISPDLDDFIEEGSNDTKIKKLSINVLNIKSSGKYELKGTTKGTMIGVNTNGVKGDIDIILNNVNIDTDSKKAPAIYVYNKDITYTDCNVTISTKENTKNYIEGGKLKKVSLLGSDELDRYSSYYSNDNLDNYNKYSSYYGIYNSDQIKNVLFSTVKADNEDLNDGDPLYFYKGSGAISSDIDLTFKGKGYLKVVSKNKEGIETKGNLTLTGSTGDYEIVSYDDCLNTTTASSNGSNARNDMIIDVNSLSATVLDDGDEGDAIDSNGKLTINNGKIYAFAHSESQDFGIDSENGTTINGGEIIATGNMADRISEINQNSIYVTFNKKIEKDSLIVIKDENDKIIKAFKTSKDIKSLFVSDSNLKYKSYKIYVGGEISGEEVNGVYEKIDSYTDGEEVSFYEVSNNKIKNNNISNKLGIALIIDSILLVCTLGIYKFIKK